MAVLFLTLLGSFQSEDRNAIKLGLRCFWLFDIEIFRQKEDLSQGKASDLPGACRLGEGGCWYVGSVLWG